MIKVKELHLIEETKMILLKMMIKTLKLSMILKMIQLKNLIAKTQANHHQRGKLRKTRKKAVRTRKIRPRNRTKIENSRLTSI
jgi:hypothetical protein